LGADADDGDGDVAGADHDLPMAVASVPTQAGVDGAPGSSAIPSDQAWSVRRAGVYKLPAWGGRFVVKRVVEGGIALSLLAEATLSPRRGHEQFQAGPGRPPRSLKKQFQAMAIPEWNRAGPLVYQGERLLFVPGLGLDARAAAETGTPRVELAWHRDDD
jgi:tRNA(Ile)-lysidine synthase